MDNLKQIITSLENSGMRQADIAEAVGTSQGHISSIKSGAVPNPSYLIGSRLIQLAIQAGALNSCPTCSDS